MNEEESKKSQEINLRAEIAKYSRHWYWFLLGVLLCTLLAFIYLRYTKPVYKISAELLVKDNKKGMQPDADAFSELNIFKSTKNIDNEIRVLKSKSLLQKTFREISHLQPTQFVEGRIKEGEIYGNDAPLIVQIDSTFRDSLITDENNIYSLTIEKGMSFMLKGEDGNHKYNYGQKVKKPFGSFVLAKNPKYRGKEKDVQLRFNDLKKYANAYNKEMSIAAPDKQASTILISINDPVPQKAKDIINQLLKKYNEEAITDKNQISKNTIDFIDERLRTLVTELSGIEGQVANFKQRNQITDISSDIDQYFAQSEDIYRKLEEAKLKQNVLNSIQSYINQRGNETSLVPSSLGIEDPTLNGLVQTYNELQLKKQEALTTVKPSNIIIQNLNNNISDVRRSISENLRNINRSMSITTGALSKDLGSFQSKIKTVPSVERELLEIKRQQGIKAAIYEYLLKKKEESLISLASTVSDTRLIDVTDTTDKPVAPKKMLIYLGALLAGLLIPFLIIYLKDLLDNKIRLQKDVTSRVSVPILGEIMHVNADEELVVKENTRTPISEMFRLVRSNLGFAAAGKKNKVIMVTSSMSGEGKTFICTNLGASLALSGKRVVVLEFDLRKPKLLHGLKMKSKAGISNYIVNDSISVDSILQKVDAVSGLHVIAAGALPPNPSELLLSDRVKELFDNLEAKFDYIIVDAPPVGQVSDAFSLGRYSNVNIYVVRYNYTLKEQVSILEDIEANNKLSNLMLILNDAKPKNSYGYGYGYGYGDINRDEKRHTSLKFFKN